MNLFIDLIIRRLHREYESLSRLISRPELLPINTLMDDHVTNILTSAMTRICPSCGTPAVDDHAQYCNKCGYPFPKTRPDSATVVRRREVIAYDSPQEPQKSASRPPARTAKKVPGRQRTGGGGSSPFGRTIIRDHLKPVYLLGAIAIVIVSLLGISAALSKTGTDGPVKLVANTTALAENPFAMPLFWIGFLVFGSLAWRILCEIGAEVSCRPGSGEPEDEGAAGQEPAYGGDEAGGGMYQCPRCGKVVSADQIRECENCGAQGCSNCIRVTGMVKKRMLCKDCFEGK